ncbi:hypothetical protein TNCV_3449361 [Trichonephila clavipes]|nr:hypothetical protein TNCV_3449361 [Trichonephila clavipes]
MSVNPYDVEVENFDSIGLIQKCMSRRLLDHKNETKKNKLNDGKFKNIIRISRDREPLAGLEHTNLKWEWVDGYKRPESGLPVMESIPTKLYSYQEGQSRRKMAPKLARDPSAVSGIRISRQTQPAAILQRLAFKPGVQSGTSFGPHPAKKTVYCGTENLSRVHYRNGDVFFLVMSRNVPAKVFLVKSSL